MSGVRINSWLDVILLSIQQKLLTDGVTLNVLISLTPFVLQNPPDDSYISLSLGPQLEDQGVIAGGGLDVNVIRSTVVATVWDRVSLDPTGMLSNLVFLTDSNLGLLKKCKCVYNSLTLYEPLDSNGDYILAEPMRMISIEAPKSVGTPGWGNAQTIWEVCWTTEFAC